MTMANGNGKKFKFIDLFAGIGGIRIAFERAGGKCVFTSEWDEPCQVMYEANFGERPFGDITKIIADEVPDHEIDKKHFWSDYFRQKLQRKLKEQGKKIMTRPVVIHENKGGNLGIHPFSTALRANGSYNYVTVNGERRLTPREMLRLQGYPDTFKMVVPDTQVRKQAGNSVVIPKIEAVARAMVQAMSQKPQRKPVQSDLFATEEKIEKIYAHK